MTNLENIGLQAKCLNKNLMLNMDRLKEQETYNKLCYLLYAGDKGITLSIKKVNIVYKIIDCAISNGNYKKALNYCCYLNKSVDEVINQIKTYSINC